MQQLPAPQRGRGGLLRELPPLPRVDDARLRRRGRGRRPARRGGDPGRHPSPTAAPRRRPLRGPRLPRPHDRFRLRPRFRGWASRPTTPLRALVAAIDVGDTLAVSRDRPDLTERLAGVRAMVEQRAVTVAVVGEFKRGKSTLVNALLQTAACPVDADIVTGVPTLVRYGERAAGDRAPPAAGRPRGDPGGRAARGPDRPGVRARRRPARATCARWRCRCRTGCCAPGCCLLDTPGVGGLESVHGQLSLASLDAADGVLFVTDASQELTAPELDYLETAVARCPRAALVVTKTDLHQHWREIVEADRGHLADAGLDIPVLPGVLVPPAAGRPEPALNEESGFAPLVEFLGEVVRHAAEPAGGHRRPRGRLRRRPARPRERRRARGPGPAGGAARPWSRGSTRPTERARSLTAPGTAWQQVLADGIQDLVADVEHDLAARLRTVAARRPRHHRRVRPQGHLGGHPGLAAAAGGRGGRGQPRPAAAPRERAERRRGRSSSTSSPGPAWSSELDSVTQALAALRAALGVDVLDARRPARAPGLSSGRMAAYVPLMALSVALHTTLLIMPPAALVGAIVGRKLFQMEGKRQRAYRQEQAKAAAGKFVDEVAFEMNKDTRDGLRRTQRRLRDEFQARAGSIQASARAALEAARPGGGAAAGGTRGASRAARRRDRPAAAGSARTCGRSPRSGGRDGRRPHRPDRGAGRRARRSASSPDVVASLTGIVERLQGPIRLAIAGKVKAGKSTLLNALIGEELAPTDAGECTRIVTWYRRVEPPLRADPSAGRANRSRRRTPGARAPSRWTSAAGIAETDRPPRDRLALEPARRRGPHRHPGHRVDLDRGLGADAPCPVGRAGQGPGRRRGALPAAAHPQRRPPVPRVVPRRRGRRRDAGEHRRRAVARRRDRVRAARRDGGRRAGRARATRPTRGCIGCARWWSRSTACSGTPPPPCARTSTPRWPRWRGAPPELIGELLLTADRFALREDSLVPVEQRARCSTGSGCTASGSPSSWCGPGR